MAAVIEPRHTDLGAYLLGVLDEPELARFERHLLTCSQCQAELHELHELPDSLDELRHEAVHALALHRDERVVGAALDQVAAVRIRRRRASWLIAATLVGVVSAVTAFAVVFFGPSPAETSRQPPGETLLAGNASTGVTAKTTLRPHEWGTEVGFELRGVKGPLQCELVAVSKSGQDQVVTSWRVPEAGYGVQGSPEPLRIQGGTGMARPDIARLEFRIADGPSIVDVPA